MADDRQRLVALADRTSALMYGVAGWLLVFVGAMGFVVAAGWAQSGVALPVAALVFALAAAATVAGFAVNPRFEREHSRSTFGRVPSVGRRVVRPEEGVEASCVACGDAVDAGLCRRYRDELVVAGVPVSASGESKNYYCLDCAATELGLDVTARSDEPVGDGPVDGGDERVTETE